MTIFKMQNEWENKAKEYGYGYLNRYGLQDRTRRRRLSMKDERLLRNIIYHSVVIGFDNNQTNYEYYGSNQKVVVK